MGYPYSAVGKWTYSQEGMRGACTAFFVNACTVITAARCTFGRTLGNFQFEASDGQKFPVRNIRIAQADADDPDELGVAFGQVAPRAGQKLADEKYGRFAFDKADTVAAASGFTPHCSYGFSNNDEGKGGRGTLDPDVYVWGPLRRAMKSTVRTDEYFVHMTNGAFGASGSPIFRCVPTIIEGKFLGVEISAPARLIGLYVRINNDKDAIKFGDRLRVEPRHMAVGVGSQQFYPALADYVKDNPC